MVPIIVIFFRESLEASLIVGIILAYLRRIGRLDLTRTVWWGVAMAVVIDLGVAFGAYHLVQHYDGSRVQTILEGITYFIATAMLTGMSFWMQRQSQDLKSSLEGKVSAALGRGSIWTITLVSAITVGREGLETVLFTLAVVFSASLTGWALIAGSFIGLGFGLLSTFAVYRLGQKVPLRLFFQVLGILLLVFAAALLAGGIEDFQALGWLPFGTGVLWNSGHFLRESSPLGDILHNFLGYAQTPSALQFFAWLAFLGSTLAAYIGFDRKGKRQSPPTAMVR